jgi:hypothetical protein
MFRPIVAALVIAATPAAAQIAPTDDPRLPGEYVRLVVDVCVPVARGQVPGDAAAPGLALVPLANPPLFVRDGYKTASRWFGSATLPQRIYVGAATAPAACLAVLANTTMAGEVQDRLQATLRAAGFEPITPPDPPQKETVDRLYAAKAVDGYIVVSIEGPIAPVNGGSGDQGVTTVALMAPARFEAMFQRN